MLVFLNRDYPLKLWTWSVMKIENCASKYHSKFGSSFTQFSIRRSAQCASLAYLFTIIRDNYNCGFFLQFSDCTARKRFAVFFFDCKQQYMYSDWNKTTELEIVNNSIPIVPYFSFTIPLLHEVFVPVLINH